MPRTLAQNAQYIAETIKPAIKSAIEAQGVTVPSTDSFLDYADRIGEISGGGSGYQLKDLPTGSISTVDDAAELPLNALTVSVEAVQDLHGYDHPWAGGAGKNLYDKNNAYNQLNMRVATGSGGTYPANGYTATYLLEVEPDTVYTLTTSSNFVSYVCWYDETRTRISSKAWTSGGSMTSPSDARYIRFDFNTADINAVQFEVGSFPTAYEPYSNICPISGWDSGEITVCDDIQSPTQTETYTHAFTDSQGNPMECYGGEWNVVDGSLSVTDGYIASYNGETLPDTWISDRDVYASGTTPTTGAEVVYKLATPTTIDLSPLSIRMLEGVNNVYADCGDVIEGEYFIGETKAYDLVEYIESDGTQVIDTGRQVVQGQTIEVTFEGSSNQTAYAWIFGGITSSDYYGYQFPNSSTVYLYNGGTSASSQSGFASDVLTQKALTFNGSANTNIHILGLWDGSAYSNQGKFKVYFLDINGDYFVPAKRRSDGVYGLYDIANSQFLTDVASGNPLTGGDSLGIRIG